MMLELGHYGIYGNEPAQKGWTAHIFKARNLSMGPFYTSFSEIVNGLGIGGNFPTLD